MPDSVPYLCGLQYFCFCSERQKPGDKVVPVRIICREEQLLFLCQTLFGLNGCPGCLGCLLLLRRTFRKAKENEDYKARLVEYCKQALTEMVPAVDSLSF